MIMFYKIYNESLKMKNYIFVNSTKIHNKILYSSLFWIEFLNRFGIEF